MKVIEGYRISPGIAVGPVYYIERTNYFVPKVNLKAQEVPLELLKFRKAVGKAITELNELKELLKDKLSNDQLQLINAQLMAIADEEMIKEVFKHVTRSRKNVAWAYNEVMSHYERMLGDSSSRYQSERMVDLSDVKRRVLHHLLFNEKYNAPKIQVPSIVICERIAPSDLIHLHGQEILGIITRYGGYDSHSGILARALNIPYVSGINIDEISDSDKVVLDADTARVFVNPDSVLEKEYLERQKKFRQRIDIKSIEGEEHQTRDGVKIGIYVNAGFYEEVKLIKPSVVKGIGLFRTEYICFEKNAIPDEDEQFELYTKVLLHMDGKPVTFRIFDFGRDKILDILDIKALRKKEILEDTGGIRFALENPSLLVTQFRALIRSSTNGEIKILLPLVNEVEEVERARALFKKVMNETDCRSLGCKTDIPIGVMIETDRAIENLEGLAQKADFLSIGTNDLAVYLLGKKRDEYMIKNHYHPEMFRAVKKVVEVGEKFNIPVYVCGEMAADPIALIGLMGVGIRSISVNLSSLKIVTELIAGINHKEIRKLEKLILKERDIVSLYKLLNETYLDAVKNQT